MQPGAAFVAESWSQVAAMSRRDDSVVIMLPPFGVVVRPGATVLYDFAKLGHVAAGVYAATDGTYLVKVQRAPEKPGNPTEALFVGRIDERVRRVALTESNLFLASDAQLTIFPSGDIIVMDPVDVASIGKTLGVLDTRGLTLFDAGGAFVSRMPLASPTAIMSIYDQGWVVADDGNVIEIRDGKTEVVARDVGLVTRVRREGRVIIYSTPDGGLFEIVDGQRKEIARYSPGFSAFDAGFDLFVDEGNGPMKFYAETQCGCRTRVVDRHGIGSTRQPDATTLFHERVKCPICQKTWTEDFPG